ncbi:MAG: hypothetical protein ABSE73_14870 [Planctomycetota bacterium]
MSEKPKKKRPWFQYHLSTAIVLMFVAGGLMWANRPYGVFIWEGMDGTTIYEDPAGPADVWGWPSTCIINRPHDPNRIPSGALFRIESSNVQNAVVCNLLTAVAILVAVAVWCEWRIRRRERRP